MIECSSHSLARMTVLPLGVGLGLYEHVRQPGAKHRNQSICVKKEWCLVGNLKGMLHKKIIFLGEQGVIYWRLTSVFLCHRPFIEIMTYTFYSERNLLWRKQVQSMFQTFWTRRARSRQCIAQSQNIALSSDRKPSWKHPYIRFF